MQSKSKKKQSPLEKYWVELLAEQPCVVCGDWPVEIHEFAQGQWFTAAPLCPACHRGHDGWHGTRQRWTLRKMDMLKAINLTVRRNLEKLVK